MWIRRRAWPAVAPCTRARARRPDTPGRAPAVSGCPTYAAMDRTGYHPQGAPLRDCPRGGATRVRGVLGYRGEPGRLWRRAPAPGPDVPTRPDVRLPHQTAVSHGSRGNPTPERARIGGACAHARGCRAPARRGNGAGSAGRATAAQHSSATQASRAATPQTHACVVAVARARCRAGGITEPATRTAPRHCNAPPAGHPCASGSQREQRAVSRARAATAAGSRRRPCGRRSYPRPCSWRRPRTSPCRTGIPPRPSAARRGAVARGG